MYIKNGESKNSQRLPLLLKKKGQQAYSITEEINSQSISINSFLTEEKLSSTKPKSFSCFILSNPYFNSRYKRSINVDGLQPKLYQLLEIRGLTHNHQLWISPRKSDMSKIIIFITEVFPHKSIFFLQHSRASCYLAQTHRSSSGNISLALTFI